MEFKNKNILISGGSSGIGLALAKKFASLGANISILARREDQLKTALSKINESAVLSEQQFQLLSADVSDYIGLKNVLTSDKWSYDILINSAGIAYPGKFVDMDPTIFKNLIDINYLGTVYLTKLIVPQMIEKRSGYIVNISSAAVLAGFYGYSAYAPPKHAICGFSRNLRQELKAYGIDMSVALPQDTDTPQLTFERSHLPEISKKINRLLEKIFGSATTISADKAADFIISGIQKKKFTIVFGIEGKIARVIAPLLDLIIYKYATSLVRKEIQN